MTSRLVRYHVMRVHLRYRPFSCRVCAYASHSGALVKAHMKRAHAPGDRASMVIKKSVELEQRLQQSIRTRRRRRRRVTVHQAAERQVSGAAPPAAYFRCVKCGFEAIHFRQLFAHLLRELKYARYVCERCDVKAFSIGSIQAHIRSVHKDTGK